MEYGMAAEPSALGAKIKFWQDNTPSEYHTLLSHRGHREISRIRSRNDAFMAMTLHRIRMHRQRILDTGEILPLVTSRGPLCTAGFVRSTTDFMIDLVEKPEWAHKLIDRCTSLIIDWLKAQHKAMGDTVEGIFILDDIVGFINEEHYQEFAHPYLKRICDAFPEGLGEDLSQRRRHQRLPGSPAGLRFQRVELGQADGHRRSQGARRRPDVSDGKRESARSRRARHARRKCARRRWKFWRRAAAKGSFCPSAAAPVPGMPKQNIEAMLEALEEFNSKRVTA